MRFLFITHGTEATVPPGPHWLPLGFAYIGALLKRHGHAVQVFDRYAAMGRLGLDRKKIDQAMLTAVKTFAPDVVGLSTISPMIYETVHCAKIIRGSFQGIILAGGHHATALPRVTLEKIPELDGVVIGEGEEPLLALAEGTKHNEVDGILWRSNGETTTGKETRGALEPSSARVSELDTLPFPDFSLFDTAFYTRRTSSVIRGFHLSTLSMLGSRGCNHRCSFCTESLVYGGGVRFHSVDYIMDMVESSLLQYPQVEGIYFHDNDFLVNPARVEQLCRRFIKAGLAKRFLWVVQTRADRLEPDLLRLMRQAGCIKMEIGVEAVAQKELDSMRKGTTAGLNERALQQCRDAGISVHAYLLTRTEGESMDDLEAKREWLKKNRPDTFSISSMSRYPGSLVYKEMGTQFFESHEWTRENVLGFYAEDVFSKVMPQERRQWTKSRFEPFSRKHHRLARLRLNPKQRWPQIFCEAILRRLKSRMAQFPSCSKTRPCHE
jgi:radical SAM superfamily enzyme YgiQ (UPF0313 family)